MLLKYVLDAIGGLMVLATAVPLLRKSAWWVRALDFPRLQILALLLLTLLAYPWVAGELHVLEKGLLVLTGLGLAYQAYMMFPYTPLARRQVEEARHATDASTFCLLFANVLQNNRRAQRLKEIIREAKPDVVLAVETDAWWRAQLDELEADYPHVVRHPLDNTYGMLLYSRLELLDPQVKFLVQDDVPFIHARLRLRCGAEVEMRCLHPRPPAPREAKRSAERDAELLIVGKELKGRQAPAVVFGDLNDVAWSRSNYEFQDISGLLDPRIGRGFFNTFHASLPFLRYPLDHCFHSRHFRVVSFKRLARFGSDHFPVCIRLSYEPDAALTQPKLEADATEKREAAQRIAEARRD